MAGLYYEDFLIGQLFDHPIRRTVTETDNLMFSALTHNPALLHLDEEYCKNETEYGRRIVNSCFTLSLMVGVSVYDTTLGTTDGNLGWDEVRFPLPVFLGDAVPFTHLFQNLVSNALKYRSDRPPRVVISAKQQDDSWLFAFQDNGIGIPKEFQTQIFGLFKRLHNKNDYPGTGIGLAICQKVVERYGGRIWVESEVGQGSTFFFTLPHAGTNAQ